MQNLGSQTSAQIKRFLNHPSSCAILVGELGSGKTVAARTIAAAILGIEETELDTYPYYRQLRPQSKTILSIDDVRDLQTYLRLKTIGGKPLRRVVVIEQADTMNHTAQNALLKTLEEPPLDTLLILLITSEQSLLETIRSRCVTLQVLPITLQEAIEYFRSRFTIEEIKKQYLLSEGQFGLLTALLEKNQEHPLLAAIQKAKHFLQAPQFERLILMGEFEKGENLQLFLTALSKICGAALKNALEKNRSVEAKKWLESEQVIYDCSQALSHSAIAKLQLCYLCLKL